MEHGKAEKLRRKITSDAEAEAAKIVGEGEVEAGRITAEAQAEAQKVSSEFAAKAEAEAKEHVRRQLSLRGLEARKAVLSEKGKVIEEVFDKALEELRKRDREGGYSLTRELLLKAVETGDEEIILSPEDRSAIGKTRIADLNAQLEKAGKRGEVALSEETRDIRGGFVLRRGRTETNARFDTLLAMLRDDIETEVAASLFGNSQAGS